jgi:flagellar biosynthetic protein FliR
MTELGVEARLGLLLVRPGMLLVSAPAFGSDFAPPPVRIALTVLLAVTLAPVVALPGSLTAGMLALIVAREVMIGICLTLSIRVLIAGVELAGHLAGFQLGFSYASLVDPQSGARNTTMSKLYGMMALFVFFAADGHHQMLRALAASYQELPIGAWHLTDSLATLVTRVLGMIFTIGIQLAAPVMLVLLVVEVMLGLMARAMPSLNLMIAGMPVRVAVGLICVAGTLEVVPSVVRATIIPALELAARLAAAFR